MNPRKAVSPQRTQVENQKDNKQLWEKKMQKTSVKSSVSPVLQFLGVSE